MSQALAVTASLFYGFADFAGGIATKRVAVWRVIAWSQLLGLALLAVGLLVVPATMVAPTDLAWGAAAGVAGLAGLALLYRALAAGTMAVVAPVSGAVAAVVPVLFDVAAGTTLTRREAAGIAMALIAIVLVGLGHGAKSLDARSIAGGIGAGALFGLFFVALAQTSADAGLWPLVAARGLTVPLAFVVALATGTAGAPRRSDLTLIAVAGNLDMAANVSGALALQRGPVGVTAVLMSLYPAVTAAAAVVVLHERPSARQLAGVVLALAAVVTLVG
jgi:drug/metabolite transporter (DMT)-like permease